MILFIQLFLAHILGDFILQPDGWVREKELRKARSTRLLLHGLVHFALILLVTLDIRWIPWALVIAGLHVVVDAVKLQFQQERTRRVWFFMDQAAHLLVLAVVVLLVQKPTILWHTFPKKEVLVLLTAVLLLLKPASVVIKLILSKWAPATEIRSEKIETPSLMHAGMMIGYLERLLIFIFIFYGQWGAIGFLVTAKSVFRFSDLKLGQDRKLTEYILIGTLLSFGLAILVGLMASFLLRLVNI